ncbi:ATP synthase subunit beta [Roseivivax halodurans JCM 10272]|uniref:ATP synthase subunit beta n=1 Tax=Roseivivax halodurans JCM 10272 TaxID=1449350 RepID=X7EBX9_9RHOB|nr:SAM-dependent methyltransferase [Roseivivax halodurans]ETX13599.1 ATP synthase subunit beta [Roseivivax halodurans JCM 10272]
MSPLTDTLTARIRAEGPMSVADWMATCLWHPEHGYYATRDPLGAAGDFTTAPEISQMFGELVGLSLAQAWMDQGSPTKAVLAELGPGRGTLMADILRATARVPGFHDAISVHLVEASPALRARQAETLADHSPTWHDTVSSLPEAPLLVVANEFFDALPIRQFQRDGDGWRERMIGRGEDGALTFGLTDALPREELAHRIEDTRGGDIVETCGPASAIVTALGARIAAHGGAGLVVDYGDWRSLGDTLQAVRRHESVPPLDAPGTADLTAHVDFEALASAASPARTTRLTPQGVFLERLGITARAQALARKLEGEALEAHIAAHHRLTHPGQMGTVFKVLGLTPEGAAPPPGLDA